MKKYLYFLFLVIFGVMPMGVFAQDTGWEIERFESNIKIDQSGSVYVQEIIAVDFGDLQKHGIYRDLPVVYQGDLGEKIYTQVLDVGVLQDGEPAEVQVTHNSANMRIRIGDADRTISGKHKYGIVYRVVGVLQAFDGLDELNWNVTGNDWGVPIGEVQANVSVPATILQTACYEGVAGSRDVCEQLALEDGTRRFSANNLAPGEGLTVAVGYESGVVPVITIEAPPSPADVLFSPVTLGVGALVLVGGVFWIVRRWWLYGRDRKWQRSHLPGERSDREGKDLEERAVPLFFKQPVSVEYEAPDDLRPAEIGVLMDEKADAVDVTATIVDLAARGYLTITEVEKKWVFGKADYQFGRTEKSDKDLLTYERELLTRLFDGEKKAAMSDLKNSFYKDLADVKEFLYEEVTKKKLFAGAPNKVKQVAAFKGAGLLAVAVFMVVLSFVWLSRTGTLQLSQQVLFGGGVGLFVSGVVWLFFSHAMPRKTGYGRELYERSRGYELFVSGTEKYRAKWMEDEGLFERVLPYAIMFGVTDKLARAFKDMGIEPAQPSWYHGAAAFNITNFSSSMDTFSTSLSSAMASSPSSSGSGGGGFSGGGFGGGGGGSW